MLASSFFDPMLGIDIHWELVPMPAPTPTPIPNPFTGIVQDFTGLAAGIAISNAIGAVMGASFKGPVLYWGAIPATNTGTEGIHIPGHILIPPGTGWAPVPKTPKPVVRPGETPDPPKPVSPDNDAIIVFGSKTVSVMGSNAVRLGDMAMSCSEPVRLPSTVVLAVPKGAPILVGGPPSLDIMAAVLASLRTRFVSDSLHALISRLSPGRFRNFLHWAACKLTGHPVDVASGKVITRFVDAELPGPLPLRIERCYSSAFAARNGPLGYGWSLSLDQAVWEEPGQVVYLAEDGREIVFDTFDFPQHRMRVGDETWHPIDRLTLRREEQQRWSITNPDGLRHEFAPIAGDRSGRARITRVVSRCRFHEIVFSYGARGLLEAVRDSGNRLVRLERDETGRVTALTLPLPSGEGRYAHRRYTYDPEGDLTQVADSLGCSWHFEYVTHLLVRETDRTGLSFYFEYDGLGADAWCTRTWGDGGIYDHVITYDRKNHVTFVTDSLGHTIQYSMNAAGLVVKILDPRGAATQYEYDPRTFLMTKETNALGHSITWLHDDQGRETEITGRDGGKLVLTHGPHGLEQAVDPGGAVWKWVRDPQSLLTRVVTPGGEVIEFEYERGLPVRVRSSGGRDVRARYDPRFNLAALQMENGAQTLYQSDDLGRLRRVEDPCGGLAQLDYDTEGRVVRVQTATGDIEELRWSPEGDLLEFRDRTHHIRYGLGNLRRVVEREEAGARQRAEYDSEGRLAAVINEAGERHEVRRNEVGQVIHEVGFDGVAKAYGRDLLGRITEVKWPSGRHTKVTYDAAGRTLRIDYSGTYHVEFAYNRRGAVLAAKNPSAVVEYLVDAMDRIVEEFHRFDGKQHTISSQYGADGLRSSFTSSLGARESWTRKAFGYAAELFLGSRAALPRTPGSPALPPDLLFERDELGRTLAQQWSTEVRVEWSRDVAGRPRAHRTLIRRQQVEACDYSWQGQDLLLAITQTGVGVTTWLHDSRRRLVGMADPQGRLRLRALDPVGNVYTRETLDDRHYGPGGRLLLADGIQFEYDNDGWVIAKRASRGDWQFFWNSAGTLTQVQGPDGRRVQFEYDAFARRTRKVSPGGRRVGGGPDHDVRYVWDGNRLVHEIAEDGTVLTWYYDPDGLTPIVKEVKGQRWIIVCDHLGTPTEMYTLHGVLVWKARLDPTGLITTEVGKPEDCPWRWRGQYEDLETGLYYNRNRYYDPVLGRYLSPDPIGLAGGLNQYAYVEDPLVQTDPFGLHVIEAFLDGVAVVNPRARNHPTWWRNLGGSGDNGMAASGFGRAGDSENRLLEFLEQEHGREGLRGRTLDIHSLGEPGMGWGPLQPCEHCGPGMQHFADEMDMTIRYHGPEGEVTEYRPCGR